MITLVLHLQRSIEKLNGKTSAIPFDKNTQLTLTFTVVQRIQLLYVGFTETFPLAEFRSGMFDGF